MGCCNCWVSFKFVRGQIRSLITRRHSVILRNISSSTSSNKAKTRVEFSLVRCTTQENTARRAAKGVVLFQTTNDLVRTVNGIKLISSAHSGLYRYPLAGGGIDQSGKIYTKDTIRSNVTRRSPAGKMKLLTFGVHWARHFVSASICIY